MMTLPRRHYSEMTAGELSAARENGWIAVLPRGAAMLAGLAEAFLANGFD